MEIKAIYYVKNSSPFHMYVIGVCDDEDPRFDAIGSPDTNENYDGDLERLLMEILYQRIEKKGYPQPESDVVFIVDGSASNEILAQVL